jgi:hypothetical protein
MSHTYPIAPFWRVYIALLIILTLVMASAFIWLGARFPGEWTFQALNFVFAAIVALIGLSVSLIALRSRLVVSPAGFEYYAVGYQVRASWDQVEGLAVSPLCSGLTMRSATVTLDRWLALLMPLRNPLALFTLLFRGYRRVPDPDELWRCIPVRAFVSHWENSDLARDLARYLPAAPDS